MLENERLDISIDFVSSLIFFQLKQAEEKRFLAEKFFVSSAIF